MAVEWTKHRFSGGMLALDAANTVVHRLKPGPRFDRFDDAAEIARFADAASGMCAEAPGRLDGAADAAVVIELREAIDALFRGVAGASNRDDPPSASHSLGTSPPKNGVEGGRQARRPSSTLTKWGGGVEAEPRRRGGAAELAPPMAKAGSQTLPRFLRAAAAALDAGAARSTPTGAIPFESALATSALALLAPSLKVRVRVCANCDWLFLDRSRNASRIWCDMAVCGNRAKARRHYRRSRPTIREESHAF